MALRPVQPGPSPPAPPAPAEPAPAAVAPSEGAAKLHPKYVAMLTASAGQETAAQAPSDPAVESARHVLNLFLKATRAAQLYPRQSKIRLDMLSDFCGALEAHLAEHGETALDIRQLEIRAFGESVYEEPSRQKSLAFRLFVNGVRGVTLRPGLSREEAEGVVDVLTLAFRADAAGEEIQTSVWERCFQHASFEIHEEAFDSGESEAYEGFLQESEPDDVSAEGARLSEESVWAALSAQPPESADDTAPYAPSQTDLAWIAELLRREDARDLFEETSELLLEALQGADAELVRKPLEEFFDHLLASGDVVRSARMLSVLRQLATAGRQGTRARALADVVERIGKSHVVPALVPLASSLTEADREGFTMLLTAMGESALGPVLDLLGTEADDLAQHALRALAPRHPQALRAYLADPRAEVVRTIVPLVAAVGREAVPALLPALRHADAAVRREALRAVAAAGGRETTDLLLGMLDDPVYEMRATALDALGTTRDPRAVSHLLARIESSKAAASTYERRELYRAVGRIGTPEATAALARILASTSFFHRERHDEARALAAAALALAGNAGARAALSRHAKDRSAVVRQAVQQALREATPRTPVAAPSAAAPVAPPD